MRIISLNLNGIRAATSKGVFAWFKQQQADIICLQETRIQAEQLHDPVFQPEGYFSYFHHAEKKGYSGTAIYTRHRPKKVHYGLGWNSADSEGRYVQIDFDKLSIASIYIPSGTRGDERQAVKMDFLLQYSQHLQQCRRKQRDYIICGDWNIAHQQRDLKNWRANQTHSGFLPEERAWMDALVNDLGYIDAFRTLNQESDQYTWWSNRGQAWQKNVGWRIDYQIITPRLLPTLQHTSIYKAQRFSDHAP